MNTFKSIDDLLRVLEREKVLMKQMFQKRPSTSLKYDYALELTEYKEERIKYLIDYGVIRDSGNFLEMEDVYLKFFEEVLQVNESINVSFVDDYLGRLNENIDYYLSVRKGWGRVRCCVPSSFSTMQTRCASVFRRRKRTSMRSTCPLPIRTSSMK